LSAVFFVESIHFAVPLLSASRGGRTIRTAK